MIKNSLNIVLYVPRPRNSTLKMETVTSLDSTISIHQTIWMYIAED